MSEDKVRDMNDTRVVRTAKGLKSAIENRAERIIIRGQLAERVNRVFELNALSLITTVGVTVLLTAVGFLPATMGQMAMMTVVYTIGAGLVLEIRTRYIKVHFVGMDDEAEAVLELRLIKGHQDTPQPTSEVQTVTDTAESNTDKDDLSVIRILFLAANPTDTTHLRLDEEIRSIDLALRRTEFRDRFEIKQHWAVRVLDIQDCLLRHKPDIVHFSGHGGVPREIILEDNAGNQHPVSVRALSQLFSALRNNIRCVVLNACYSEDQARAIAEHVDCVIGMSKAIGDRAAISFSTAFYQALGYGKDVKTAFDLGCIQIDLQKLGEQDVPKLLATKSNPEDIVFVHNE